MKKFLAVYLGSAKSPQVAQWEALDEKAREEREKSGMIAWRKWVKDHQASIVEMGGPLGETKQVSLQGTKDLSNALTGFTLIRAESHEAAAKLFLNHPHFAVFPGDSVEIMEVMPIPGQ